MMMWKPFASNRHRTPALALAIGGGAGTALVGNGDLVAPCGSEEVRS